MAGSVHIRISRTEVFDLIVGMAGRDVSFRTNVMAQVGVTPCYGWSTRAVLDQRR